MIVRGSTPPASVPASTTRIRCRGWPITGRSTMTICRASPTPPASADQSIALPVGPHIDVDDMDYMAQTLTKIVKELSCSKKS